MPWESFEILSNFSLLSCCKSISIPRWTHSKRWWMNRMFASQELIEFNPNTCAIDKVHFPFHSLCLLRRSRKVFFACLHAAKNRANYFPLATWVMMHFLSLSDGKKEKSYSGGEMLHINFMVRFCFRFRMANVRALQGAFCKAKQKLFRDVLHKNFSFHREQMTSWETSRFIVLSFAQTVPVIHFPSCTFALSEKLFCTRFLRSTREFMYRVMRLSLLLERFT